MKNNIKTLMYISNEDFYLMVYTTLIFLNKLIGKKSKSKTFKDHRKLFYIIKLLSDYRLIDLLIRYKDKKINNPSDKEFLFDSFTKSELHKREVNKILKVMEKKGYINLEKTSNTEVYNISLNEENLPTKLIEDDLFEDIDKNSNSLKTNIRSLNIITLNTFIDKVYRDHGVNIWDL
ncbi:conserved hypothetical protein [Vibrio crassostreae]|uniref:hypothetical protein n=1 Tax=Vibrio crassostreae TaxID=246167 RepID=UPI00104A1073|nr:hypothetical protein [Vibrio crassostreae]TCT63777.1 hypothetical protein EDB40_101269 [Vibrio crassostreae]CAK2018657.1 conserved hypothetical protein [Vibrio crassostreae]CAK2071647.1 conserved hypothetical protein [Vibrio crassostreae]CAK2090234.1 conserved hypothetical protein [Vibrio crassostreae]CAK2148080.1 conserved hypothetical protein [Vibrio crassostreae]